MKFNLRKGEKKWKIFFIRMKTSGVDMKAKIWNFTENVQLIYSKKIKLG